VQVFHLRRLGGGFDEAHLLEVVVGQRERETVAECGERFGVELAPGVYFVSAAASPSLCSRVVKVR